MRQLGEATGRSWSYQSQAKGSLVHKCWKMREEARPDATNLQSSHLEAKAERLQVKDLSGIQCQFKGSLRTSTRACLKMFGI